MLPSCKKITLSTPTIFTDSTMNGFKTFHLKYPPKSFNSPNKYQIDTKQS